MPKHIDKIEIANSVLLPNQYVYNREDALINIPKNLVNGKIIITAEARNVYDTYIDSNTLTISAEENLENEDYNAIISLKDKSGKVALPKTIKSIYSGGERVGDDIYTYDNSNGKLHIDRLKPNGDIVINAEEYNENAYQVLFTCDEHSSVSIYKTQFCEEEPVKGNVAYSVDGKTGEYLKDGKGQINFKLNLDDGYDIDYLSPIGLYGNLKGSEETKKEDVYRITKIRGQTKVRIKTKKIGIKQVSAFTDVDNNKFSFSWNIRNNDSLDSIQVDIKKNGSLISTERITTNSFELANAEYDVPYEFNFTPVFANGKLGSLISLNRMITKEPFNISFPRIEINTLDNTLPSCSHIDAPSSFWGVGTVENDYVKNTLQIYNSNNEKTFDSTAIPSIKTQYDGSKIKIRGNTSSLGNKKPYKIKLSGDYDLLESYRLDKKANVNYTNKEWLLLATGNSLNQMSGFSIAKTLEFDWRPECQYCYLYLNGDFQGLYVLCESVSRGNGENETQSRYKIDEDGFLFECDAYWWNEDTYFETNFTKKHQLKYTLKYPDVDDISDNDIKIKYLQEIINNFETKLENGSAELFEIIDLESFAKWLLAHDFLVVRDTGGSNIYLFKKSSNDISKIKMGTVWDFDSMCDSSESLSYHRQADHFYCKNILEKFPIFSREIVSQFNKYKDTVIQNLCDSYNRINNISYNKLLKIDGVKYNKARDNYESQKSKILHFMNAHINYMINRLV